MRVKLMAVFMALIVFILALLGMAFTCWGAYIIWFLTEWGIIVRIVFTCIGVVPGAIVSIGFLIAVIRDVFALITGTTESGDAVGRSKAK